MMSIAYSSPPTQKAHSCADPVDCGAEVIAPAEAGDGGTAGGQPAQEAAAADDTAGVEADVDAGERGRGHGSYFLSKNSVEFTSAQRTSSSASLRSPTVAM